MSIFLLLVLSFFCFFIGIRLTNIVLVCGIFFLSIFSYGMSTDFFMYDYIYNTVLELSFDGGGLFIQGVELSFAYISQLVDFLGGNSHLVISIYSFSSLVFIFTGVRKINKEPLFIFIFIIIFINTFYFANITLLRQTLAASILFFSICDFLVTNNKLKYISFVIIASLIHSTAFIFIFMIVILNLRLNINRVIVIFSLIMLLTIFNPFQYLINFLPSFLLKFSKYLLGSPLPISQKIYSISITLIMFTVFFVPYFFYMKNKNRYEFRYSEQIVIIFFLMICIRGLAISMGSFGRLSIYFTLFIPFYFYYFMFLKVELKQNMIIILCLYLLSFFKLISLVNIGSDLNNYESIVLNFCFFGEPCPINIYSETSLEKFNTFI